MSTTKNITTLNADTTEQKGLCLISEILSPLCLWLCWLVVVVVLEFCWCQDLLWVQRCCFCIKQSTQWFTKTFICIIFLKRDCFFIIITKSMLGSQLWFDAFVLFLHFFNLLWSFSAHPPKHYSSDINGKCSDPRVLEELNPVTSLMYSVCAVTLVSLQFKSNQKSGEVLWISIEKRMTSGSHDGWLQTFFFLIRSDCNLNVCMFSVLPNCLL